MKRLIVAFAFPSCYFLCCLRSKYSA